MLLKISIILLILMFLMFFAKKKKIDTFNGFRKNILHNYFDLIYVITLDKRKTYIKNVMKNYNIQPIILDAYPKNKIDRESLIKQKFIDINYKNNNGRIACHYSHILALKKFLNSNKKNCLIFEDDIKDESKEFYKFEYNLENSLKKLPKKYDIIYLGRCWDNCTQQIKLTQNLVKAYSPKCRHAYGVSRSGAEKIIKYSLPMKNSGGDTIISNLIKKNHILAYAITPQIFRQNRDELGSNLNNKDNLYECDPNLN